MRRTAGSMPAARAASLCRRRLSSPKQNGMTPGGEHASAFVPPSIVAPTSVTDGAGRFGLGGQSDVRRQNHSPNQRRHNH